MNKDLLTIENSLSNEFNKIDEICLINSKKVLDAFHKENIQASDFDGTSGYGYGDIGRDKRESIFASMLGGEDALVRSQIISGTHALTITLFGLLRPNDTLLSISGLPYDTLHEVIGIIDNPSSLKSYGIKYDQIDLKDNDFDDDKIIEYLKNNKVKVIEIQRSKGYSTRKSLSIDKLERIISKIKKVSKDTIIMVDNCYCEITSKLTPTSEDIGCDIMVGSLIKNLGGGIAPNGAYVAGKSELVDLVAERLTVPGQGAEVGPSLDMNKLILEGLYMAPSVVASSLKTNIFASCLLNELGFSTNPKYNEEHVDIVLAITFNNPDKLISYVEGIQEYSAIDNYVRPIPCDMPGYSDKIIMASGSFTSGSSIEISCDGPIREPYIAYMQGGLTYQYGRLAVINAVRKVYEER
jgi:cystathionine beta-lyase family protein involved in aluminum resistance